MQGLAARCEARNGAEGCGAGFPRLLLSRLAGPSPSPHLSLAGCTWRGGEARSRPGHEGDSSAGLGLLLALEASLPQGPGVKGLTSDRPVAAGPPWRRQHVSPSRFSPKAAISDWVWRGTQSRCCPSQPIMALGLQPPAQHDGAEGASFTLPGGRDSPALTFPSHPLHQTSATPEAGFGGKQGAHPPVPAIGAVFAMASHAPPAKMS